MHFVVSTKNRERWIADSLRDDLDAHIGGILQKLSGTLPAAGSVEDHLHLLVAPPGTSSPAESVEAIKVGSSKWIKTKIADGAGFHWQHGYGAFSISPSHRPALEQYFAEQAEHHRRVTFHEEFRRLPAKYRVPFDERYVWD